MIAQAGCYVRFEKKIAFAPGSAADRTRQSAPLTGPADGPADAPSRRSGQLTAGRPLGRSAGLGESLVDVLGQSAPGR